MDVEHIFQHIISSFDDPADYFTTQGSQNPEVAWLLLHTPMYSSLYDLNRLWFERPDIRALIEAKARLHNFELEKKEKTTLDVWTSIIKRANAQELSFEIEMNNLHLSSMFEYIESTIMGGFVHVDLIYYMMKRFPEKSVQYAEDLVMSNPDPRFWDIVKDFIPLTKKMMHDAMVRCTWQGIDATASEYWISWAYETFGKNDSDVEKEVTQFRTALEKTKVKDTLVPIYKLAQKGYLGSFDKQIYKLAKNNVKLYQGEGRRPMGQ
jgi:hypothetical protein